MSPESSLRKLDRRVILAVAALAYFVVYPDELSAILASMENVLSITNSVSPWLYLLIGTAVIAWTLTRIFGRSKPALVEGENLK